MADDRIRGLRVLADVEIDLSSGLTVLIGENGSGKSSIVEACELFRKAGSPSFLQDVLLAHGGPPSLLRQGSRPMELGITVTGSQEALRYSLAVAAEGRGVAIDHELLEARPHAGGAESVRIIDRDRTRALVLHESETSPQQEEPEPGSLLLASYGMRPPHGAIRRVRELLEGISVHLPFDSLATWAVAGSGREAETRESVVVQPTRRLRRLGGNLANAYHALRNDLGEAHWQETLEYVRMGLGETVETVTTPADAGGGRIGIGVKYRYLDDVVRAYSLSDGTLAYLAMVALFRLSRDTPLLVFDEPETHLHPELLLRVLSFFEALAEERPVLLATHSGSLLDGLTEPWRAALVCELDRAGLTRLRRLDEETLRRWLSRYRGLGDVRGAGFLRSTVLDDVS